MVPLRKLCLLSVVSYQLVGSASGQGLDTTDYFPLGVNNRWIYLSFEVPPYYSPDSVNITKTQIINDTLYYVRSGARGLPFASMTCLRKDSLGNVYSRMVGRDQLVYNVRAQPGAKWNVEAEGPGGTVSYTITLVSKFETVIGHAGVFENCLRFLLETHDISEATYYVWLAPGTGEVRKDGWGLAPWLSLKRAFVNEQSIGSRVFHLYQVTPRTGETNVDPSTSIRFFFDSIPPQEIADTNIRVVSRRNGVVMGSLSKINDGWAFAFTPQQPFAEGDTITVTLSARITDWFGDTLDGNLNWIYEGPPADDYAWTFYTHNVTSVQGRPADTSRDFVVHQNYPNPFNSETIVEYSTPAMGAVNVRVFNVVGQEVRRLVSGPQEGGKHSVVWDARDDSGSPVASGVYLILVGWNRDTQTINIIYLK